MATELSRPPTPRVEDEVWCGVVFGAVRCGASRCVLHGAVRCVVCGVVSVPVQVRVPVRARGRCIVFPHCAMLSAPRTTGIRPQQSARTPTALWGRQAGAGT